MFGNAGRNVFLHLMAKPVQEPPGRMIQIAANLNLRKHGAGAYDAGCRETWNRRKTGNFSRLKSALQNRDDAAFALCACKQKPMKCPSERHNGTVRERDGLGQTLKLPSKPIGVTGKESVSVLDTAPVWQG